MTYTLFYTAPETDADGRPNGQWSVRSTQYAKIEDPLPIRGTDTLVSGNLMTEARANEVSDAHQRRSYAETRKAAQDAQAD